MVILPTTLLIIYSKSDYKIFNSKILAFIGKISFSIYIWHYLFFSFARHANFFNNLSQKILILFVCICFSILSYFFYEKKLRDKKIVSTKTFYKIISLNLIAILITASIIILNEGFSKRLPIIKNYKFDNVKIRDEWLNYQKLSQRKFNQNNKINILIIGNSHGQDIYNSMIQNKDEIPDFNLAIISISKFRCFLENFKSKNCFLDKKNKIAFDTFLDSNIVIFHNRWTKEYIHMIKKLNVLSKKNNKKLIIALNREQFNYGISNSLTTLDKILFENYQYKINEDLDILFERSETIYFNIKDPKITILNDEIKKITDQLDIITFDFSKFQCNYIYNLCYTVTASNEKIYWDYGHFTLEGAKHFGKLFLKDNDFLTMININR